MKLSLLLLSLSLYGQHIKGQSFNISTSSTNVIAGQTVTLSYVYTDTTPSANLADIQWGLTIPAGFTLALPVIPVVNPPTIDAVACYTPTFTPCIFGGIGTPLSNNVLPSGTFTTQALTIPQTTAAGSVVISLTNVLGASTSGIAINLTSNTVTLNVVTLQTIINQSLGLSTCTTGDINGDGKCNVLDLVIAIRAILGV